VRGLAVIAGIGWLISCSLLLPEAECDVDADCDSGVCDRRARACVAESDVSYVEPEECRPGRLCTREFPCCSIDDGVSGAISQRLPVVHLAPVGYAGPVEIEATTPLRLLGHGATLTVPESDTGLATSGDERLEIDGLAIRGAVGGATQTGLRATGAELSLFQISVRSIAGNGVVPRSPASSRSCRRGSARTTSPVSRRTASAWLSRAPRSSPTASTGSPSTRPTATSTSPPSPTTRWAGSAASPAWRTSRCAARSS
jgi:hypothetical protein